MGTFIFSPQAPCCLGMFSEALIISQIKKLGGGQQRIGQWVQGRRQRNYWTAPWQKLLWEAEKQVESTKKVLEYSTEIAYRNYTSVSYPNFSGIIMEGIEKTIREIV